MFRKASLWVLTIVALSVPPPLALGAGDQTAGEVRLYTNADLERFGDPDPAQLEGPTSNLDHDWELVNEFLDREQSRIEADQRLSLERSLAQPATAPSDTYVAPYLGGYYGYYGGAYGYGRGTLRRGPYRLPRYDLRTARHGYLVPARRRAPGDRDGAVTPYGRGAAGRDVAPRAHGPNRSRARTR